VQWLLKLLIITTNALHCNYSSGKPQIKKWNTLSGQPHEPDIHWEAVKLRNMKSSSSFAQKNADNKYGVSLQSVAVTLTGDRDQIMAQTIRVSNLGRGKKFYFSPKHPHQLCYPYSITFNRYGGRLPGGEKRPRLEVDD